LKNGSKKKGNPGKSPKLSAKRPPNRGRADSMEELRKDMVDTNAKKSPYIGPNPTKDRMKEGEPGCVTYFGIRKAMSDGNDNVYALKRLLPAAVHNGQDFRVWPRQCLLLHGLVKQGCVDCVTYLVTELGFDVNYKRHKDGCTPLHNAFYNLQGGSLERMVHKLVDLGADQTVKNKYGEPPCMFAFKAAASPLLSPMAAPTSGDQPGELDLDDLSLGAPASPMHGPTSADTSNSNSSSIFTCNEKLNSEWRQALEKGKDDEDMPELNMPPPVKIEYSKQLPTSKTGKASELYSAVLKAATVE